ncbi:hypothetical protein [Oerskovia jenensis]|uniref:hypothetical protein n=1 Tax=Oerskovia jenensis TaxID=162169 RepID=UPI0036DA9B6A
MKQLRRSVLALVVLPMFVVGCVSTPSRSPVAIGVRMDDGVVRVILPNCPGETFAEAIVTPIDADEELPQAWSAVGLEVDSDGPVELSRSDWTSVAGSYDGLTWFGVELRGSKRLAGTVIDELQEIQSLPEGIFHVDGQWNMTLAEYREHLQESAPCP